MKLELHNTKALSVLNGKSNVLLILRKLYDTIMDIKWIQIFVCIFGRLFVYIMIIL